MLVFLLFLIVFIGAFFPAIFGHYVHHDDYLYIQEAPTHGLGPRHGALVAWGRVMGAWIVTGMANFVSTVADYNWIRFLSVLCLALCAVVFYHWIRPFFVARKQAFLISAILFTLPTFQVLVMWAVCMYETVGLLLAAAAAVSVSNAYAASGRLRRLYIILFLQLLVSAFLTYQPSAMFFWAMIAIRLICKSGRGNADLPHEALFFGGWGMVAMGVYAFILKVFCQVYFGTWASPYNPYNLETNIWDKLVWFVQEPLFNALNLWNIFPLSGWVWGFALATVSAAALHVVKEVKQGQAFTGVLLRVCGVGAFFCFILLLIYLPNLLNKQHTGFYRTSMGIAAMVVFAWCWSVKQWARLLPHRWGGRALTSFLGLTLMCGVCYSFWTIDRFRVLPSQMELEYVKGQLLGQDLTKIRGVAVIQPPTRNFCRHDEYGCFSSVSPDDVSGLVYAAAQELGMLRKAHEELRVLVETVPAGTMLPPDVLLIDMRIPESAYTRSIQNNALPG